MGYCVRAFTVIDIRSRSGVTQRIGPNKAVEATGYRRLTADVGSEKNHEKYRGPRPRRSCERLSTSHDKWIEEGREDVLEKRIHIS
jgi:hypothetical protein